MPETPKSIIDFVWSNKEWLFSGLGVFVLTIIISIFRRVVKKTQADKGVEQANANYSRPISSTPPPLPLAEQPEKKEKQSHIVEYVLNTPLNPNLTPQEVAILRRFVHFPRSQYTQGYRLDWIYDELLADIPKGTTYAILESLLAKGYLEKWVTRKGNRYYTLSEAGIPFLVNNGLIDEAASFVEFRGRNP